MEDLVEVDTPSIHRAEVIVKQLVEVMVAMELETPPVLAKALLLENGEIPMERYIPVEALEL